MKRREFIAKMAAIGLGAAANRSALGQGGQEEVAQLARRPYGNTGRELSIIGLGGIVVSRVEQAAANNMVAWAVDRGTNYFDVAPTYGNAEQRLGPALKPYRDDAFLACKTQRRDAPGAREQLEASLATLQTDHLDLYQLHGLRSVEEVDQVMGPGGAMETFCAVREEGKVLYLGFSAHSVDAALKAMDEFDFDSILFPVNVVCFQNGNFGRQVLEKAQEKGVAVLALKAMAWSIVPRGTPKPYAKCWYRPIDDVELARRALSWTLDLPVVAAVAPGDEDLFQLAVELGLQYQSLTDEQRQDLIARTEGVQPIFEHATEQQ